MKSLIALIALGLVLGGCGNAAEEIAERAAEAGGGGDVDIELDSDDEGGGHDYFFGVGGISRTDNTLGGVRQVFWIAKDAIQTVTVIERDGEGYFEVTLFETSGS